MDRTEFVQMACAMAVKPVHEASRRDHVREIRATAEAMADELGLAGDPPRGDHVPPFARERIRELETRVAELEAQLEQATAPSASKKGPR